MSDQLCTCGRPTAGEWLCDDCQTTFKWALVNVAAYYPDLGTIANKQARYSSQGVTKGSIGKEQPLVVDMRFVNGQPIGGRDYVTARRAPGSRLRWEAWATIVAWCRAVMEDQPEIDTTPTAGPAHEDCGHGSCIRARGVCATVCLHVTCAQVRRRRWPDNTIPSMCNYLARQFRHIASQQWAPDMMGELLDLEKRLRWMVDRPADKWYAGRCSAGDEDGVCQVELYASTERGKVTCTGCGAVHDVDKRRDILLDEAKNYHVTATEAASALLAWTDYDGSETKLVDRIRKWRDREQLEVADVTSLMGRDRHLYRLGDIQDLLVGDAQEEQGKRLNSA